MMKISKLLFLFALMLSMFGSSGNNELESISFPEKITPFGYPVSVDNLVLISNLEKSTVSNLHVRFLLPTTFEEITEHNIYNSLPHIVNSDFFQVWYSLQPATCMPDHCFCEEVKNGLIRQPVNTWSNLAFIFTGILTMILAPLNSSPLANKTKN